jgi:hypothetical protein
VFLPFFNLVKRLFQVNLVIIQLAGKCVRGEQSNTSKSEAPDDTRARQFELKRRAKTKQLKILNFERVNDLKVN